jgi:hypothetical protein
MASVPLPLFDAVRALSLRLGREALIRLALGTATLTIVASTIIIIATSSATNGLASRRRRSPPRSGMPPARL